MQLVKYLILSVIAVFAPAKAMILTSFALVLVDLITGIMAAKVQKQPITSAGLRRTAAKLFIYELAVLLGFLTQQYLTGPEVPVASIIAGLVGLTELTSCLENLNVVSGNDMLKAILDKLGQQQQK